MRSDDRPDSVTSLAYSEMDSSPAVNFLSAFADATIPSIRTEMSPIQTVPSQVLEEGDQVAGYVIGQIIGRGGFSVVREARHPVTEQRVAVKIVQGLLRPHPHITPPKPSSDIQTDLPTRFHQLSRSLLVHGHDRQRASGQLRPLTTAYQCDGGSCECPPQAGDPSLVQLA
ncbi:hypothetical protein PSTG_19453, partial [Puccinia striiformis f. sp. tritici PST-78]